MVLEILNQYIKFDHVRLLTKRHAVLFVLFCDVVNEIVIVLQFPVFRQEEQLPPYATRGSMPCK